MIRSYDSSCAVLSYRRRSTWPSLINRSDYRLNVNEFPRDRRRGWIVVDHRSKRTGAGNVLLFVRSMPSIETSYVRPRCKKSRRADDACNSARISYFACQVNPIWIPRVETSGKKRFSIMLPLWTDCPSSPRRHEPFLCN